MLLVLIEVKRKMTRGERDVQSRVLKEVSALVLNMFRSPPAPITFSGSMVTAPSITQISPTEFAALLLGISVALILCGSLTFFMGIILMPWALGLMMLVYVAGIVSTLAILGRSILC